MCYNNVEDPILLSFTRRIMYIFKIEFLKMLKIVEIHCGIYAIFPSFFFFGLLLYIFVDYSSRFDLSVGSFYPTYSARKFQLCNIRYIF